jgi:hypothetical protein
LPDGCSEYCGRVDSCGPQSYEAVEDFSDYDGCFAWCSNLTVVWTDFDCRAEFVAYNHCFADAECPAVVAFLNDPTAGHLCVEELDSLTVCALY